MVTDDGPGLSVTDLAEANELLADPPAADPPAAGPPAGRAGLHAAALLAANERPVSVQGGPPPPRLDIADPTQMSTTTAAEDRR